MSDQKKIHPNYLRISVTDRCNLRCLYCMPSACEKYQDREGLMSQEEILRIVNIFVDLGATRVRITGGEPL